MCVGPHVKVSFTAVRLQPRIRAEKKYPEIIIKMTARNFAEFVTVERRQGVLWTEGRPFCGRRQGVLWTEGKAFCGQKVRRSVDRR
jgi:hypothetical protein